ncbi:nhr-1 [Pristionchus pacificus]|nr:nhr-1 [Pristionchus pacificus]
MARSPQQLSTLFGLNLSGTSMLTGSGLTGLDGISDFSLHSTLNGALSGVGINDYSGHLNETLASALSSSGLGLLPPPPSSLNGSVSNGIFGPSSSSIGSNSSSSHLRNDPAKLSPTYKRMAQRRKVPEGELCAVCSDLATGYHYGVASCNGCKTFFRRTIVSEQTFICQYNGNCDVNKNIRCACRHCRFNKCIQVGMDAKAIQNDRDRIGPTKKIKMGSGSDEDPNTPQPRGGDQETVEHLLHVENLCAELRKRVLPEVRNDGAHGVASVENALNSPCLLFQTDDLKYDIGTEFKELYPASMKDVRMWNIKEMRICIEWVKTFDLYCKINPYDQFALLRNFAFAFNVLNRVYYSPDHGPDKIVYLSGAFILRNTQNDVKLSGCRLIYTRQMDEIMIPLRRLQISTAEFALFKAALFFNPDAPDLSSDMKIEVYEERNKYLSALFMLIVSKVGLASAIQKYGALLMMTASIQNIITANEENMQVMELFKNWEMDPFVKELCLRRPA